MRSFRARAAIPLAPPLLGPAGGEARSARPISGADGAPWVSAVTVTPSTVSDEEDSRPVTAAGRRPGAPTVGAWP